jgi:hypothetical protein
MRYGVYVQGVELEHMLGAVHERATDALVLGPGAGTVTACARAEIASAARIPIANICLIESSLLLK